jgi:hypothetical protein
MERRRRITLALSFLLGLTLVAYFGLAFAREGKAARADGPAPALSWTGRPIAGPTK